MIKVLVLALVSKNDLVTANDISYGKHSMAIVNTGCVTWNSCCHVFAEGPMLNFESF